MFAIISKTFSINTKNSYNDIFPSPSPFSSNFFITFTTSITVCFSTPISTIMLIIAYFSSLADKNPDLSVSTASNSVLVIYFNFSLSLRISLTPPAILL